MAIPGSFSISPGIEDRTRRPLSWSLKSSPLERCQIRGKTCRHEAESSVRSALSSLVYDGLVTPLFQQQSENWTSNAAASDDYFGGRHCQGRMGSDGFKTAVEAVFIEWHEPTHTEPEPRNMRDSI
jgi:hypothetical protein